MPSNQGGPWGGGGGGGGPWGGGGNGPSGGGNPWGGRNSGGSAPPPDLEEILRKGQERMRRVMPGGSGGSKGLVLIGAVAVLFWLASGVYRVNPDEVGVELLFGKYVNSQPPGLHIWFPTPIGEVMTPTVTRTNQITIGYRGATDPRSGGTRDEPQESMMLTGDQNIIDVDFIVQWRINDAGKYLFNIREVEATVKLAAESAMREVVGQASLDYVMTDGRTEVGNRAQLLLQQLMDSYQSGVSILDVKLQKADPPAEVIDAFNDVQRARQDKERLQNEAQAFSNDIVPRAKGEAARLIQEANAYKDRVVKDAEGEAARFLSVYDTYRVARDVTVDRLYLEAMQDVLRKSDKIILDDKASGSGVVPYLPLNDLGKRSRATTNAPRETKP